MTHPLFRNAAAHAAGFRDVDPQLLHAHRANPSGAHWLERLMRLLLYVIVGAAGGLALNLRSEPTGSLHHVFQASASQRAHGRARPARHRRSRLQKAKVATSGVSADVDVEIVRSETRRLRVGKVNVTLHTKLAADHPAVTSCLGTFEDFCIVTQSVRHGIEVDVRVQSDG